MWTIQVANPEIRPMPLVQGRRKQVKVGGAQAFKALFHTKRAPSSKFIFG